MACSRVCIALAAAMVAVMPGMALAQFPPPPPPPGAPPKAPVQDRWPDPPKSAQPTAPVPQRAPAPAPAAEETLQAPDAPKAAAPRAAAKSAAAPHPPATAVACSGVFAKDSTHLKLAIKYDSRNVVFGEVDGPDGAKIPGSILFPNDPKRRLEVLWVNDTSRADVSVIAINGKSQWTAPKGMKLGLPLAALEKANGRPFKLSGFGADGTASVVGWEGGALSSLPGGCKLGMRVAVDAKASQDARSALVDKELLSNDASVRAVKPAVVEILIGY